MTKQRTTNPNQTQDPTEEITNTQTQSNNETPAKIRKEHKKSRIVDTEKKLAELEEVF